MALTKVGKEGITGISNSSDATAITIDSSERVGIGETSPAASLHISTGASTTTEIRLTSNNTGSGSGDRGRIAVHSSRNDGTAYEAGRIDIDRSSGTADEAHILFATNNGSGVAERMRITSGGSLLVGKTDTSTASEGAVFTPGDLSSFTRNGNTVLRVRRNTDGGDTIQIYQDGDLAGAIGSVNVSSGERLTIGDSNTKLRFNNGAGEITPCGNGGGNRDNVIDLGDSGARFDDIHATNGTIQTSDKNEKEQIASLTTAEITAAKAISKLFKTFKWKDKVVAKGDAARTHTGVIAQEVQTAMSDAGLDASKYAFWCSDTWWEDDETYTDDDGAEQTRTNTYDTADEAPEGATQRTRLGVRYPELLAFIGAATEQRLADIETRLTALEGS